MLGRLDECDELIVDEEQGEEEARRAPLHQNLREVAAKGCGDACAVDRVEHEACAAQGGGEGEAKTENHAKFGLDLAEAALDYNHGRFVKAERRIQGRKEGGRRTWGEGGDRGKQWPDWGRDPSGADRRRCSSRCRRAACADRRKAASAGAP